MIAEVAVFGFTLKPVTYSYAIPDGQDVQPGQLVKVPFGKNLRQGVIVSVGRKPPPDLAIKEVMSIESNRPSISAAQLELAAWISKRYFISMAEALHLMLPRLPKTPTSSYQNINKGISQELCLFPTLRQAEAAAKANRGLVFSHSGSVAQFNDRWQQISRSGVKRIFGARSALFAPFNDLKKISIFQTESDLYKEERRPYYRSMDVAQALAKVHHASIRAVSYSPRVQDHFKIPHLVKKLPLSPQVSLVNLRQSKILSPELTLFLQANSGKRILVFLNRKSERGPLVCRVCKVRSYVADPSACPNCGSSDVKFQLLNLSTLSKELSGMPNLEFSTQQIFFQDTPLFDAVVVASADTYLNHAGYLSTEKTYQMMSNLLRLLKPGGKILVQTAYPDDKAINYALKNNYQAFYQSELVKRREFGYPPFSEIAKLTYQKKEPIPDLRLKNLEIFGPFQNGLHQYLIVRGKDLAELSILVRPWKLDIDPLNL